MGSPTLFFGGTTDEAGGDPRAGEVRRARVTADRGFELVDVEVKRAAGNQLVRLFVDKPGGIGLDDLQSVSEEVSAILDAEDPIEGHYTLEVSSPGLDRLAQDGGRLPALRRPAREAVELRAGGGPPPLDRPDRRLRGRRRDPRAREGPGRGPRAPREGLPRPSRSRVPKARIAGKHRTHGQSAAPADRADQPGEEHQSGHDHRRHRGRDPDRLARSTTRARRTSAAASTRRPGQIEVFAVKQIVEDGRDPRDPDDPRRGAQDVPGAEVEIGQEIEFPSPPTCWAASPRRPRSRSSSRRCARPSATTSSPSTTGRVGEVVNGIVKRQEMGDFIVDLGRAEALLPRKEQSRAEAYQTGDRVRVAIVQGGEGGQGPPGHREPHRPRPPREALRDGGARDLRRHRRRSRAAVREAGERAKIAVHLAASATSTRWAPASA